MKFRQKISVAKRLLRRVAGVCAWAIGRIGCRCENTDSASLLLIYDFASQPFSVGDILTLQEAALVQCSRHGLSSVDIALVYDPMNPVVSDPAFKSITRENFLAHLSVILPAAQVNPILRSLLLFGSHKHLEKFIADNAGRYVVWPSLGLYAAREYLFYHCIDSLFPDYFRKHGNLPRLSSRPAVAEWAISFLAKHAEEGLVPISIQLRNNPTTPARNSNYPAWVNFFSKCAKDYPAKFFVICAPSEIEPGLRILPNVVIAKDFHTSLEQDLAIIEASDMHMGASSGPGTIALFNRKPYCMFGFDGSEDLVASLGQEGHRIRYSFSAEYQYWIRETETYEILLAEFENLWKHLSSTASQTVQESSSV